jgi:hypothetical protein
MNNEKFKVYDMSVDYSLLGTFPNNINSIKSDEQLIDLFIECFKMTFSGTVFSYYGDLNEAKEHIEASLLLDELDFKNRNNKRKWLILFLVVMDMFFKMHNTYLAQNTLEEICDNFDYLTEEELFKIIHDLNFALFFGIEECLVVSPSKIRQLEASDEDNILLPQLIDAKDDLLKIIKSHVKRRDINVEQYEAFFKEKLTAAYTTYLYDGFIGAWIEMIEFPDEDLKNLCEGCWESILTDILALAQTFFSLVIKNEIVLQELSEDLYFYIANLYKKTFKIKYPIYDTP